MPKPTTVKLSGSFEMKDTVSAKALSETIAAVQAQLVKEIGPGSITLRIGRQEIRA